jgi:hypothetical protein
VALAGRLEHGWEPPMTTPEQAAEPVPVLKVELVETPAGQRLAVTLTMLMDAAGAKAYAAAIDSAASKMSATGLMVVEGILGAAR